MHAEHQPGHASAPESPVLMPLRARPAVFVESKGHHYVVDPATGEVISSSKQLPRKPPAPHVIGVYVGMDTRWPSTARDANELLDAVRPFDTWLENHYLSGQRLLDLLDAGVTASAVRVMRYVAGNITARNHWFGRIADLAEDLNIPPRTVERSLMELVSKKLIRRQSHGKSWPVRISVHPWYVWRGNIQGRDTALAAWIGLSTANFDG